MGSNELDTVTGPVVNEGDFNKFKEALTTDFLPRDVDGFPEDNVHSFGTSLFGFLFSWFEKFTFSGVAASIIFKEVSQDFVIERNGVDVVTLQNNTSSVDLNEIKDGTIKNKSLELIYEQGDPVSFGTGANVVGVEYPTSIVCEITTHGRPVLLILKADFGGNFGIDTNANVSLRIYRNGTLVNSSGSGNNTIFYSGTTFVTIKGPPTLLKMFDHPPAGTYTYELRVQQGGVGSYTDIQARLEAYEF